VLIALTGAITALAAPSGAAATGTIKMDKSWYTITPSGSSTVAGSTVKVTVTDADANDTNAATLTQAITIAAALGYTSTPLALASGEEIVGTPHVLTAGDSACAADKSDADADITVTVQNAATGVIVMQSLAGSISASSRMICYDKGQADNVNITLLSTQDTDGIYVSATETGINTGKFEATIILDEVASTSTSPFKLKSLDLDGLTAKYKDSTPTGGGSAVTVSATASVEQGKPAFSSLAPADKLAPPDKQPAFTGTINDVGGAGIDVSEVYVYIAATAYSPTITGTDGDTSITYTYTPSAQVESSLAWYVKATDMAGNTDRSDGDSDTSGDQDYTVKIDISAPAVLSAKTGVYFDATAKVEKGDKLTSLVVRFDDDIDGDTVSAADFTVAGIAPVNAEVFTSSGSSKKNVYLTVADNLAADAKPKVVLSGTVSDLAGNSRTGGTATAADEIAPTFTVSVDDSLVKSADKVLISVSSSEKISGVPSIKVHNINGSTVSTLSVVVKTTTSWEATFTASSSYDLKNSVVVIGADPGGNSSTKGDATITSGKFGSKALQFTVDVTAPTVTYDAAGVDISSSASKVESFSPYVTMTFNEKIAIDKVSFGLESLGVSALTDVTADGNLSSDSKKWIYSAAGLTEDAEYTIAIEVKDLAGNKLKGDNDFTVIALAKTKIPLSPGNNLISLPSAPADSAINTVVTGANVVSVITYDAVAGTWLSATRDADSNLTGTLSSMDALHAYWVNSTSFAPIEVDIPAVATAAVPPAITVVKGWNLVPVVSQTGNDPGDTTGADTYFGSTSWVTAYTFAAPSTWTKVTPATFQNVTYGNGYWLYVDKDGVLVP